MKSCICIHENFLYIFIMYADYMYIICVIVGISL